MANNVLNEILENQNNYIHAMEVLVNNLTRINNSALENLNNDDESLTDIKNSLKDSLDALYTLTNRYYGYTHDEIVTNDLEEDYQSIITENPALANVSAVGMLAVLKDGDTVTSQGNRLFINGEEVLNPSGYTFSGTNSQNGIEIVKIWYFENEGNQLTLQKLQINTIKTSLKTISAAPLLSTDFYDYIDEIEYDTIPPAVPILVKKQKNLSSVTDDKVSPQVIEYENQCTSYYSSMLCNKTLLKYVRFPNLITIQYSQGNDNFLKYCESVDEIYFPKLQTIGGASGVSACPFHHVKKVVVPETVLSIGATSFHANGEIVLNCKNAASIANNAFYTAPNIFTMCTDWGASINIATAAAGWSKLQFIDLFNNKLRDMTLSNETRTLTIPSAKLTELQADTDGAAAIASANAKGWTIGGA